jgi:hypothetical protein
MAETVLSTAKSRLFLAAYTNGATCLAGELLTRSREVLSRDAAGTLSHFLASRQKEAPGGILLGHLMPPLFADMLGTGRQPRPQVAWLGLYYAKLLTQYEQGDIAPAEAAQAASGLLLHFAPEIRAYVETSELENLLSPCVQATLDMGLGKRGREGVFLSGPSRPVRAVPEYFPLLAQVLLKSAGNYSPEGLEKACVLSRCFEWLDSLEYLYEDFCSGKFEWCHRHAQAVLAASGSPGKFLFQGGHPKNLIDQEEFWSIMTGTGAVARLIEKIAAELAGLLGGSESPVASGGIRRIPAWQAYLVALHSDLNAAVEHLSLRRTVRLSAFDHALAANGLVAGFGAVV